MKTKTMGTDQDFKIGTRSGYPDVYKRQNIRTVNVQKDPIIAGLFQQIHEIELLN